MPARGTKTTEQLRTSHTAAAIKARLRGRTRHSYLSDFIYGGIDGAVTTFAVVSGVAGAGLDAGIILILGCANLLGDGFSMAAANYLGVRAEQQQIDKLRSIEGTEIDLHPDGERDEIREIYRAKGIEGEALEAVVDAITADRERWIDAMITEEHGMALEQRSPWRAGGATFAAFMVVGAIPLVPFTIDLVAGAAEAGPSGGSGAFAWSTAMVAVAFFAVGALKCRFVLQRWWIGGLETLFVGGLAAGLAYLVGMLLGGLVG
jgi:VIT1/CCC1 family predicted Fe2+/Mn2+ transporter